MFYYSRLTPEQSAAAGGLGGIAALFLDIVSIVFFILLVLLLISLLTYSIISIIASWKVLKKADEKGWKILVPFYNLYTMFKIVDMKKWFWIVMASSFAVGFVICLTGFDFQSIKENGITGLSSISLLFLFLELLFFIIVKAIYASRLSRVFGHKSSFAVGLFFLYAIFAIILAVDSCKYDKKRLIRRVD